MSSVEVVETPTNQDGQVGVAASLAQLDLSTLMSQPLHAVIDAQVELSMSTLNYIKLFGIDPSTNTVRNVAISHDTTVVLKNDQGAPILDGSDNVQYAIETNTLNLPLITLLNVPSLQIKKFTIDLTIELVSIQDISSSEVDYDMILSSTNFLASDRRQLDAWSEGYGSGGNYRTYAKGSSSSGSSSQAIKYDLHLEAVTTHPPGLTMLMDFLSRNRAETTGSRPI